MGIQAWWTHLFSCYKFLKRGDHLLLKFSPFEHACFQPISILQEVFHIIFGTEVPAVLPMLKGLHITNLHVVNIMHLHKNNDWRKMYAIVP